MADVGSEVDLFLCPVSRVAGEFRQCCDCVVRDEKKFAAFEQCVVVGEIVAVQKRSVAMLPPVRSIAGLMRKDSTVSMVSPFRLLPHAFGGE